MAKNLLIVESPAKAKTIGKYLGRDFQVKASVGHIVDLAKSGEKKLGVDIKNGFKPDFRVIEGKNKVVDELKRAAKGKDNIYLACDPDREGEAIAWHIKDLLDKNGYQFHRLLINEITRKAVRDAISNPQPMDQNRFNAQITRRILDRLVGFQVSQLLWKKVQYGLSAGRVQSVAVRLVCEREEKVKGFVPIEYWSLIAQLQGSVGSPFEAKLVQWKGEKVDNKNLRIENETAVRTIVDSLVGGSWVIGKVEKKERHRFPSPPFITSKLQQEAARKLGYQPQRTMQIAQKLYEGIEIGDEGSVGLITYMRTDSTRVSTDAIEESRRLIQVKYGDKYLPANPNQYRSKKGAQDAHEAIRPTSMEYPPERVQQYLRDDSFALYSLIWNRFVSSQMCPALFDQTAFDIQVGEALFRATGQQLKFEGFLKLYSEGKDEGDDDSEEKEAILPDLKTGAELGLLSLDPKQHFTQPPPRFSQATLIKKLEEEGIGRPSTYASIISSIVRRHYVILDERRLLLPSYLGILITELLIDSFPDILNVEFTAGMEDTLDKIEEGKEIWHKAMEKFYTPFARDLKKAEKEMRDVKREEIPTEIPCEKCGNIMVIKWGRFGEFLACPRKSECKNTKNFTRGEGGEIAVAKEVVTEEVCNLCGQPMQVKWGRFGQFLGCSGFPKCRNILPLNKPVELGIACPTCGEGKIIEKTTRRGKFFYGCNCYPKCEFATWMKPIAESCPTCKAPFVLEKVTKKAGRIRSCFSESCNYKIQVEQ